MAYRDSHLRATEATANANGAISALRPRYGQAASAVSARMVGTISSAAYSLATASAAGGAASRYSGHRDAAVRKEAGVGVRSCRGKIPVIPTQST